MRLIYVGRRDVSRYLRLVSLENWYLVLLIGGYFRYPARIYVFYMKLLYWCWWWRIAFVVCIFHIGGCCGFFIVFFGVVFFGGSLVGAKAVCF